MARIGKKEYPTELIREGSGYEPSLDLKYDKKYIHGNNSVSYIVAPKINEEENKKRLREIEKIMKQITGLEWELERK